MLRYDQRGHGASNTPDGPYSFDLLVADVIALMDHHGIATVDADGVASVVAGSLGLWFAEDWHDANPEAVAAARAMIERTSSQGYIACCHARKELDYLEDLPKVTLPVLYVCGEQDKGAPPEEMRAIAHATPSAEYVEIPNAGHVTNMNQPEVFNAAIADFLDI